MSDKCKESIIKMGFCLVEIPQNPNLDKPVCAHPDISVFSFNNSIIAENRVVLTLKERMFLIGESEVNISEGCKFEEETLYPHDCVLNFAVCGKRLIGNMKHINGELLDIAKKNELELISVNQGYAKCNICVVNDDAIITEDKGIAEACRKRGIDVLLLNTNSVKLDGYKYGFIGGATGTVFDDDGGVNKILFCGSVEKHPEFYNIDSFCKSHGAVPVSLSDDDLCDYGSIIIL